MTNEQISAVEKYVNDAIATKAQVICEEMHQDKAKENGVQGSFWEKYPDVVKVFTIKGQAGKVWSCELCGGPHVAELGGLGVFKIEKEESSSRGVRRIKAVLQ